MSIPKIHHLPPASPAGFSTKTKIIGVALAALALSTLFLCTCCCFGCRFRFGSSEVPDPIPNSPRPIPGPNPADEAAYSLKYGKLKDIEQKINSGAIDCNDPKTIKALLNSDTQSKDAILHLLVENITDVDMEIDKRPLVNLAAEEELESSVISLIDKGAKTDVDEVDRDTLTMIVIKNGWLEVLKKLPITAFEEKKEFSILYYNKTTCPMEVALDKGHDDITLYMAEHLSDVDAYLTKAVEQQLHQTVNRLIENGAKTDISVFKTPLIHHIIKCRWADTLKLLPKELFEVKHEFKTPLQLAMQGSYDEQDEMAAYLVRNGANVDLEFGFHFKANILECLKYKNMPKTEQALKDIGYQPPTKEEPQPEPPKPESPPPILTPEKQLSKAMTDNQPDEVLRLVNEGATWTQCPLHWAIEKLNDKCIETLAKRPDMINYSQDGKTPLEYYFHQHRVKFLGVAGESTTENIKMFVLNGARCGSLLDTAMKLIEYNQHKACGDLILNEATNGVTNFTDLFEGLMQDDVEEWRLECVFTHCTANALEQTPLNKTHLLINRGLLRKRKPTVADIDFLVTQTNINQDRDWWTLLFNQITRLSQDNKNQVALTYSSAHIDRTIIMERSVIKPEEWNELVENQDDEENLNFCLQKLDKTKINEYNYAPRDSMIEKLTRMGKKASIDDLRSLKAKGKLGVFCEYGEVAIISNPDLSLFDEFGKNTCEKIFNAATDLRIEHYDKAIEKEFFQTATSILYALAEEKSITPDKLNELEQEAPDGMDGKELKFKLARGWLTED